MKDHIYSLGSRLYKLHSTDKTLLDLLDKLLPKYDPLSQSVDAESVNLDDPLQIRGLTQTVTAAENPSNALAYVIDRALADHGGFLWIDASAMLTPKGELVLIAGPSHSGKTSLSLCLALAHNWKIVAEDIVLIDRQTQVLTPFARPLTLRPDTAKKIQAAVGINPETFSHCGWTASASWYNLQSRQAKFDFCLDLAVTDHKSTAGLRTQVATSGELIRSLISHSNALRYENGVSTLSHCLETSKCCFLNQGTLPDRIKYVLSLTGC